MLKFQNKQTKKTSDSNKNEEDETNKDAKPEANEDEDKEERCLSFRELAWFGENKK